MPLLNKKYEIEFEGEVGVFIRNTSLNSWNLHETSVILTRGTEIRNQNLTRPALIPQPLPHLSHIFLL